MHEIRLLMEMPSERSSFTYGAKPKTSDTTAGWAWPSPMFPTKLSSSFFTLCTLVIYSRLGVDAGPLELHAQELPLITHRDRSVLIHRT